MSRSLLEDAFAHHIWATLRLIDACLALSPEQLDTTVPGTYGSILDTMRHLVGDDSWSLFVITGDRSVLINPDNLGLSDARVGVEANGAAWSRILGQNPDPDVVLHEVDETDGFRRDAPIGIFLAQALHHGTDHRSQVCTALTTLGIEPPNIDVLAFGVHTGSSVEIFPKS